MSTHFHVWCETCETEGPQIRRGAGGVGLQPHPGTDTVSITHDQVVAVTREQWASFLIDHQYHDVRLFTEHPRPLPPPPSTGADFQPVPTHLIPPDDASPRSRTLCCDRAVMMLDSGHHVTVHEHLATCPGNPDPPADVPR